MDVHAIDQCYQQLQGQSHLTIQALTALGQKLQGAPTRASAADPSQPVSYPQPGSGGGLQGFLGSGFGRAIAQGAAFGIGDDLINHLFGR
jgi:hypothetical protein